MKKGISLHIGLNSVDPNHYNGWSGDLQACENDARDMKAIADAQGFTSKMLLTGQATREAIVQSINEAAGKLKAGDVFLITNSCHGGQLPDKDGDEQDMLDETWCLFDGEIMDDELYLLYSKFAPGVRIVIFSDSCNSGTVAKLARTYRGDNDAVKYRKPRSMPVEVALGVYQQNKAFYDEIIRQTDHKKAKLNMKPSGAVKTHGLLISGAQDGHYSYDGQYNGAFTEKVKIVWNGGVFAGKYPEFHHKIKVLLAQEHVTDIQNPNYFLFGDPGAEQVFMGLKPFEI